MEMSWVRWLALLLGSRVLAQPPGEWPPCPAEPSERVASPKGPDDGEERSEAVNTFFRNKAGVPLKVYWVDTKGDETELGELRYDEEESFATDAGDIFHFRAARTGKLVSTFVVEPPKSVSHMITPCVGIGLDEMGFDKTRWPEYEGLVAATQMTCEGEDTSKWSCVRHVSQEENDARDKRLYGFTKEEAVGTNYVEGTTIDKIHRPQIRYMPNMTNYEGGFLKMQMPEKMKRIMLEFYHTNQKSRRQHELVPGYFTNNHKIPMDKLNMEHHPATHSAVVSEMEQVFTWWTHKRIKHVTTFGVRIYKRGSMLINHLDRKESHLISAIMQVHQIVDKDGGWPVEVLHPHKPGVMEAYLQPGEMLLYEGARLEHGRPMRFRGEEFANVFSHFAPLEWTGPKFDYKNPNVEL